MSLAVCSECLFAFTSYSLIRVFDYTKQSDRHTHSLVPQAMSQECERKEVPVMMSVPSVTSVTCPVSGSATTTTTVIVNMRVKKPQQPLLAPKPLSTSMSNGNLTTGGHNNNNNYSLTNNKDSESSHLQPQRPIHRSSSFHPSHLFSQHHHSSHSHRNARNLVSQHRSPQKHVLGHNRHSPNPPSPLEQKDVRQQQQDMISKRLSLPPDLKLPQDLIHKLAALSSPSRLILESDEPEEQPLSRRIRRQSLVRRPVIRSVIVMMFLFPK